MAGIPELKKKISAFLTKEDGSISKAGLIKAGIIASVIGLSSISAVNAGHNNTLETCKDTCYSMGGGAQHCNDINLTKSGLSANASHYHCAGESVTWADHDNGSMI